MVQYDTGHHHVDEDDPGGDESGCTLLSLEYVLQSITVQFDLVDSVQVQAVTCWATPPRNTSKFQP